RGDALARNRRPASRQCLHARGDPFSAGREMRRHIATGGPARTCADHQPCHPRNHRAGEPLLRLSGGGQGQDAAGAGDGTPAKHRPRAAAKPETHPHRAWRFAARYWRSRIEGGSRIACPQHGPSGRGV
ncbi:hypothetical protein KXV85_003663, partial [Aspergillus fumigatus]